MASSSGHNNNNSSSHHSNNSNNEELVCNACGFEASFVPEGMLPCERCQKVHYCSLHCLQWDWKSGGHANVCVDIRPVEQDDDEDDDDSASGRGIVGGLYGFSQRQKVADGEDDEEEDSLVSMDVNHIFDDSKASSVASAESSTNAPTRVVSNQQQPQWEEKSKGTTPSTVVSPPSSPTGGGLKLGTFFESQKKQQLRRGPPSPTPPNPVEDEYYEEDVEEEEIEVMSDSIDLASGPDNLKSIVEESEVTGDEPDLEGSWRSRDPFVAAPSEYTSNGPPVVEEEAEDEIDDDGDEGQDDTEEIFEEVTEEEIVEESYESTGEDLSSEVMEVVEDDEVVVGGSAAVEEPDSEAFRRMKARSYGEASAPKAIYGTQGDSDNSSTSSNGVGALMDEFGYDSNMDGDSSESTGSLEAEASGDTTRTDDTSRLAAQPAYESDPSQMRRLMDEDSTEDDDENMLFAGVVRPPRMMKPSEIGSLYTITSHHDSSNCTITTDDQSAAPAGQGSKEPSSSAASTGQISGEKSSATAVVVSSTPTEQMKQPKSPRFGDSDQTPAPEAPPRFAASSGVHRRGSAPMSLNSDVSGRQSASVLSATDTAQRRHSGPRSPSSLLDFRNVYSNSGDPSAGVVKDHTQALKDFRLAYQADSTPPTTPSSTATSKTTQSSLPATTSPGSATVPASSLLTGVAGPESPANDPKVSGQSNTLTVSINKALRDYETLYGTDAAQSVVLQLARGAELEEAADAPKVEGPVKKMISGIATGASFAEPVVVATVRIEENGENTPTSSASAFSRESNSNAPPVASNGSTARTLPSTQSAQQRSESASNASRPRYLAYRNLLSRGVATPEKPSERPFASSPSASTSQESEVQAGGTQHVEADNLSAVANGDAANVEPFDASTVSPKESDEELGGIATTPVFEDGLSSTNESTHLSQGNHLDSQAELPRYLAYRTNLASNSRSADLTYDARMDLAQRVPGNPVDHANDLRHNVDIHFSPTQESQSRSVSNDGLSAPIASTATDSDSGSNPASTSMSRYQNYDSHLASTAPPAASEQENGTSAAGLPDSGSKTDPPLPRYLTYRETIARRVAPSAATGVNQTAAAIGGRTEIDVDENEMEQRLSSYLQKGMIGTAAASTMNGPAVESQLTSQVALQDTDPQVIQPPAAEAHASRYTPEPLRSKRAAAALAMAQEAQRQRSHLKPAKERDIAPVAVTANSASRPPPMKDELDLEAGVFTKDNGEQPEEPASGQEKRQKSVDDGQGLQGSGRSRRFLITLVVVILIVVSLVVGLSVGLTNKYRDSAASSTDSAGNKTDTSLGPAGDGTSPPTSRKPAEPSSPTESPTIAPSQTATARPSGVATQELLDLLSGLASDGGASIQEAGTPQYEAFTWLSSSPDLALLNVNRRVQRYSLATLYYSTGGENWRSNDGWLSDENECDWFSRSASVCDNLGYYTDLSLGFNDLEGTVPAELALLSQLTSISLSGSMNGKITGTVPRELSTLSSMTFFSIRDNGLEGQLSDVVEGWPLLEFFDVGSNLFTGTFPQSLAQQTELREIDLSANQFEGPIPDIGALTNLERLTLSDNRLTGALQGSLSGLTSLRYLNVQMNQLTSLPNSVGLLTSLEVLEAYDNSITGKVFNVLDGLSRLQVMDLHMNQISGVIPRDIGSLSSLRTLDLSGNQLDGEIPSEMGLLGNLTTLFLQANQLSGVLPTELGGLKRLSQIRIDDNNLTGEVPEEVCSVFSQTLPTFYLDCGGSDPQITCPPGMCCTYCCEEDQQTDSTVCQCLYEGTRFDFLCKE